MGDYLRENESSIIGNNVDGAGGGPAAAAAAAAALSGAPPSTISMAMLFGSMTFATASLAARLWLTGTWGGRNGIAGMVAPATTAAASNDDGDDASNGKKQSSRHNGAALDVTSLPSIYSLLYNSTVFGLILFYSYLCENHPPYFHEEKNYDRDEFFFWTMLVVVFAGGHSLKRNGTIEMMRKNGRKRHHHSGGNNGGRLRFDYDENYDDDDDERGPRSRHAAAPPPAPEDEVLNRYQTEEWKGWMQFSFLLYHYMHATEIYNGIRVMITCYIWMTGYGNASFFYVTGDYSLPRVLQMAWRLNFLVFFLCLTHGNSYVLYYICPLHTYFFAMVYAIMYVGRRSNYTRWWIRIKIGIAAVVIFLLWDCDLGIFERLHGLFLSDEPTAGATMGSNWEWYFRSYLDHWSTLLGMVFAINFPITSLFYRKLDARGEKGLAGKAVVAAGMLFALGLWATGPLTYPKIQYNSTNPYLGCIPLLAYVYLRNLTPGMRSRSMELLHEIGKTTLETYLMQHHIWLTSNSKTILVFLPGWPRVNLALVTYVYVKLARRLHGLTMALRGALLPNDDAAACVSSMAGMAVTIAGFYCAAFLLDGADMTSLAAVGAVCLVCGALLYQSVIDSSWSRYRREVKESKDPSDPDDDIGEEDSELSADAPAGGRQEGKGETIYTKFCPPLVGAMVLLVLGLVWNGLATAGAGPVGPLPPGCDAFVNEGTWIPLDGCNESSRGMAYRDHGAASYGTCAPHGNSYVWAWRTRPSRTRCRFGHRSEEMLRRALRRREIVYVGDSMTRYLYHASMRAMGVAESGAYDATGPKHADIFNMLWDTTPANFKWAPLAADQLGALREINRQALEGTINPPDLIVLGGGAWDRLHVYASDEDRQSHASTLKDLGHEMRKAQEEYGAAVVWFIPTTINSQALNTEEKRDHMREEDMEAMRAVYARNGILSSSSFVVDGPAFTSSRVSESYDGVHYPIQVYSAGAQILFNALDWLLPPGIEDPVIPPRVGKMANPKLGALMLVLVTIGLVCFDGFLGFSYLASLFVKGVGPHDLYEEAFSALHRKIGLPSSDTVGVPLPGHSGGQRQQARTNRSNASSKIAMVTRSGNIDEEIAALLGSKTINNEI